MPPIQPDALHYRYIAADYGGTYTHRAPDEADTETLAPEHLTAVGTYACQTCVGVYFKISSDNFFVAHINASHLKPVDSDYSFMADDELYGERKVTLAEGAFVYDETIRRLEGEARRAKWPDVRKIEDVALVCPYVKCPVSDEILSRQYVAQGIRAFLRRPNLQVRTDCEGFVVTHETAKIEYFPFVDEVHHSGAGRPLADDGVKYVAHGMLFNDETKRWFIDIDEIWRGPDEFAAYCVAWGEQDWVSDSYAVDG